MDRGKLLEKEFKLGKNKDDKHTLQLLLRHLFGILQRSRLQGKLR